MTDKKTTLIQAEPPPQEMIVYAKRGRPRKGEPKLPTKPKPPRKRPYNYEAKHYRWSEDRRVHQIYIRFGSITYEKLKRLTKNRKLSDFVRDLVEKAIDNMPELQTPDTAREE